MLLYDHISEEEQQDLYDHLSEEERQDLVTEDPWAIRFISNPSIKVQKLAITKDGSVIRFFSNPSEEIKKFAVYHNGIDYIANPSLSFMKSILDKMNPNNQAYDYLKDRYTKKYLSQNNLSIYE